MMVYGGIARDGNEETAYGNNADSMDEVDHQLAVAFGFSGYHGEWISFASGIFYRRCIYRASKASLAT